MMPFQIFGVEIQLLQVYSIISSNNPTYFFMHVFSLVYSGDFSNRKLPLHAFQCQIMLKPEEKVIAKPGKFRQAWTLIHKVHYSCHKTFD